jgi:hypothetical protein
MKVDEALRKIRLLSGTIPQNGASEAEAKTAANLARTFMERFAIRAEDARPARCAPSRLTWVYWERVLGEFGVTLNRFGRHGNAALGKGLLVFIRLDTGHWCVKKQSSDEWMPIASDFGVESLRAYLRENGPRSYSMAAAFTP